MYEVCHETNHKVFSRNTCRKNGSNRCLRKKKEEVVLVFRLQRQGGRSQKLSSDWAENLADSNKELILRPGALAEGVELAAKHRMRPVGIHINI